MKTSNLRLWIGEKLILPLLRPLVRLWFRARVNGLEHLQQAGERRVLIANHCSLLDGLLLAVLLPCRLSFGMSAIAARRWWGRPAKWFADVHEIDPENPYALRALAQLAAQGRTVLIFPEGRLTTTGALMKTYPGAVKVALWADASLVPIWLTGFARLPFTRCAASVPSTWRPRLTLTVCPPVRPDEATDSGDLLRAASVRAGMSVSEDLFSAVSRAIEERGAGRDLVDDHTQTPVSGRRLLALSLVIGNSLLKGTAQGEMVGLMLPNSAASLAAFLGATAVGRVPAMLNPAAGLPALHASVKAARIRVVWTSKALVEKAGLGPVLAALEGAGVCIHYLDTEVDSGFRARLLGFTAMVSPRIGRFLVGGHGAERSAPAVVLFTSGSSGTPKGVVLSHENLLAQASQLLATTDICGADKVFNALPLFHAFGLTGATLVPLLAGGSVHFHPTPLDYARIPELVYRSGATVLPGTSTFLVGWARRAHDYDFRAVRLVIAGAEPVREAVRELYSTRFGLRILEGYGCTECAPVIALNSPLRQRKDAAGWLVPSLEMRLEAVEGLSGPKADGTAVGRLLVRGPNVMLGYLLASAPGELMRPVAGWHDTGDIVSRNADGSLRIVGRAARFAKIGGEMISLAAVEAFVSKLSPAHAHAVVARAHPVKGEEIVLVTEDPAIDRRTLAAAAVREGVPELWIPKVVIHESRLPILATGKLDLARVGKLVETAGPGATPAMVCEEAVG